MLSSNKRRKSTYDQDITLVESDDDQLPKKRQKRRDTSTVSDSNDDVDINANEVSRLLKKNEDLSS